MFACSDFLCNVQFFGGFLEVDYGLIQSTVVYVKLTFIYYKSKILKKFIATGDSFSSVSK